MEPLMASSAEWCEAFNVTVYDPDGWDRTNFDWSWAEIIDSHEFLKRFGRSTVLVQQARTPDEARAWLRQHRANQQRDDPSTRRRVMNKHERVLAWVDPPRANPQRDEAQTGRQGDA